jgi:hypothetical protein
MQMVKGTVRQYPVRMVHGTVSTSTEDGSSGGLGNIIYAGIRYSTAQGDPGAASAAKKRIREAIIAFLMYIALYSFIQWLVPGGVF